MRKLFNKLKLNIYVLMLIIRTFIEDLVNKLNGREVELDHDLHRNNAIHYENSKLRRGIQKITRTIYDENGKLKDKYKRSTADLIKIANSDSKSLIEQIEKLRIEENMLANPTDYSGTDEAMVQHNVKNAHRYLAAQQKRKLHKELRVAMTEDNIEEVKRIRRELASIDAKR